MRTLTQILLLAVADYRRERLLSLCTILSLTAVLAPLLILYGVKLGVMTTLTERMLSDPKTLEITPVVSGHFTMGDIEAWRHQPGVDFVLPRTRSIAATMQLAAERDGKRLKTTVSLEPTAPGDPLMQRYRAGSVTMVPWSGESTGTTAPSGLARVPDVMSPALREAGCVLSDEAARRLGVQAGSFVLGFVERASAGFISTAYVRLRVTSVLPLAAQQRATAYVPLDLMLATEDFRDHRAVPELGAENGWTGENRPEQERVYASFRLYADSMDSVAGLRAFFAGNHVETYTHAEEIEQIRTLEHGLSLIFMLICSTAAAGFFLSTASNVKAGIKRKERILGLLQLNGFSTGSLMLFPLTQALLTALLGSAMAVALYALFSTALNTLFTGSFMGAEAICRLSPWHFLLATAICTGISLLAAFGPALRSARIEPSEVIRDV